MDVNKRIEEQLTSHDILLYMKGTPDFPQCGFSGQAVAALFASKALLTQHSIKVGLGYSSAAHMGFMLMVCGLGVYAAAILHLVAHSFYKAHAFLSSGSVIDTARAWINAGAAIFEKPLSVVPDVQRVTNSALSLINQSYVGDITISPLSKLHNPLRALSWRTQEEITELVDEGERATWPRIERIRIQTRISRTLDPILRDYEDQHIEHYGKPVRATKSKGARPRRRKAG